MSDKFSDGTGGFYIAAAILVVLFYGEPDLQKAAINYLNGHQCVDPIETTKEQGQ